MSGYDLAQRKSMSRVVAGLLKSWGAEATPGNVVLALSVLGWLDKGIFANSLPRRLADQAPPFQVGPDGHLAQTEPEPPKPPADAKL